MPGGSGCPSFVPAQLIKAARDNRQAIDALSAFADSAGGLVLPFPPAMLQSVALALDALANNCDVTGTWQAECKQAATGCTTLSAMAGIAAGVAAVGVISIPFAAILAPLSIAYAALAPVFGAMGDGRTPKLSDITNVVTSALAVAHVVDPQAAANLGANLDSFVNLDALLGNPTIKAAVASGMAGHADDSRAKAKAAALEDARAKNVRVNAKAQALEDARAKNVRQSAKATALEEARAKNVKGTTAVTVVVPHDAPVAAKKSKAGIFGVVGGVVGGFLVGGPIGAVVGGVVGGVGGSVIGKKAHA